MSAAVNPPATALYIEATAERPEVDEFGLLWPSLNRPYWGLPLDAHPSGSVARARRSFQPIGSSGQPSARATGFHIAMTCGEWTIEGFASATHCSPTWWLRSRPHRDEAGAQITGLILPSAMAVSAL